VYNKGKILLLGKRRSKIENELERQIMIKEERDTEPGNDRGRET
jgi:hypothetical protein